MRFFMIAKNNKILLFLLIIYLSCFTMVLFSHAGENSFKYEIDIKKSYSNLETNEGMLINNKSKIDYEVVIIGAGISGLSAAYELKDKNILILEKEDSVGGRILTRFKNNVFYDIGAIFCLDYSLLPFKTNFPETIFESAPIGLLYKSKIYLGGDVLKCIEMIDGKIKEEVLALQKKLEKGIIPEFENMSIELKNIMNAFFQVIYPGSICDYIKKRQTDAYHRFATSHYANGNKVIIDEYKKKLSDSNCIISLNSEVLEVEDTSENVKIHFLKNGQKYKISCKSVIVATTASVASKIINKKNVSTQKFLDSISYGKGIVVVLGVKDADPLNFSYMVTPELIFNTIIQQKTSEKKVKLFLIYYTADKERTISSLNNQEIVNKTISEIIKLKFFDEKKVVFTDIFRWNEVGPIINTRSYENWNIGLTKPSPNVYLAGEYVFFEENNPLPYGMTAALKSGLFQAKEIIKKDASIDYSSKFLIDSYIYEIDNSKPTFIKRVEEGNIAFYGIILKAFRDKELQNYLWKCKRDELWEYQKNFGVTAEDSAIVIEGLLENGITSEILIPSIDKLIALFWDKKNKSFQTIIENRGRAGYWNGISIDATSMIGYLMDKLDSSKYEQQILGCSKYIAAAQLSTGEWKGKWFNSQYCTTFFAARFLCSTQTITDDVAAKVVKYITSNQKNDGSIDESIINTSAALLTLKYIANCKKLKKDRTVYDSIKKLEKWLISVDGVSGRYGEPILYYFYEKENSKFFYHCVDKGAISGAWAKIALEMKLK